MKKKSLSSLFENKTFVIAFSILMAVISWIFVVNNISTDATNIIADVPIDFSANSADFTSYGLDIIDKPTDLTVTVTVKGARSVVGSLTADDLKVTPDYTDVVDAGIYELPLRCVKANSLLNFTIVSIKQGSVQLRFDIAGSKKLAVEAEIEGLGAADGYIVGTVAASPAEISISGPDSEVNKVARAVARCSVPNELSETTVVESELVLLDAEGNPLSLSGLLLETKTVEVTVPVLKRASLPLAIDFINLPEGFDSSTLSYVMSLSEIPVAAPANIVDKLTTKTVGYIDLAAFQIGESYSFDITLPSGVLNLSGVESVSVTFPREGLDSTRLTVSEIRLDNLPANYDVEVVTKSISDVTIIGPAADVEAVTSGSVAAVIDLNTISVEKGEYYVAVKFVIPAFDSLFVAGSYTAVINVTPK